MVTLSPSVFASILSVSCTASSSSSDSRVRKAAAQRYDADLGFLDFDKVALNDPDFADLAEDEDEQMRKEQGLQRGRTFGAGGVKLSRTGKMSGTLPQTRKSWSRTRGSVIRDDHLDYSPGAEKKHQRKLRREGVPVVRCLFRYHRVRFFRR